uniref:Uncharacterized protein LOC100187288 n=1 Tax=Phallusia mammillata TaxID=59560 RepID=A0A6F9DI14_9ASCI|nr:uncharacterized protein LOC100187288 [Phallusia mammillata]
MSTGTIPQSIPIRRIKLNHMSELPHDYGTTPGGTLFSTTPGGTRIIYDRSFLLKCRASPMSNTPPSNLPDIPGVTSPDKSPSKVIGRIEEEKEIPKENGGYFWQLRSPPPPLPPPPILSPLAAGFDAFPVAKGPLQQYRQRNFMQQNSAIVEKTCLNVANSVINAMHMPPPVSCLPPMPDHYDANNNQCSGDGLWQLAQPGSIQTPNPTYPTSQLNAWRQAKFNQVISQAVSQTIVNAPHLVPTATRNVHNTQAYRGRGRGMSQSNIPGNLCKPMQKLFMSKQGNNAQHTGQFSDCVEPSGMPMYGQLHHDNHQLKAVDENSNVI